ncbi:hypothetical protein GCM10028824_38100 [Hymenobacter segetis]|uniref:Uncharacterized protein n=1 Tax=Hymenobacter segetis TaxID=2025509 RepID=A0ABU9LTA0_9BACT
MFQRGRPVWAGAGPVRGHSPIPPSFQVDYLRQPVNRTAHRVNCFDDEAALLSTGLSLGKIPERHTTLETPTRFQLVDGPQPGTLCAKAKCPPHAVAMKYLYTLDANLLDIE